MITAIIAVPIFPPNLSNEQEEYLSFVLVFVMLMTIWPRKTPLSACLAGFLIKNRFSWELIKDQEQVSSLSGSDPTEVHRCHLA